MKFVVKEDYPQYSLEVEFNGKEIGDIMNQLSDVMPKIHRTVAQYFPLPSIKETRKNTAKGLILSLIGEGWFDAARNLIETQNKMRDLGYNHHRSNIAHALKDLWTNGILARLGICRHYQYQRTTRKL